MSVEHNTRDFDPEIVTDFRERMSYGAYLDPVSYTHLTLPTIYSV